MFLRVKETLRRRRNNRLKVERQCHDSDTDPAKRGMDVTAKTSDLGASNRTYSPLTVQDLVEAECAILKFVQSSAFGHEIRVLEGLAKEKEQDKRKQQKRKKASVKSSSSVYRLDPFMDGGVLRVGGRLNRANLPHEVKHPVILPRKGHVTTLLIRHTHKSLGHAGRGHVIAALREKYWIIKVNAAVRRVLSKCVFCRCNHGKPNEQKMADLPRDRISPAPPFTYTGIDYFGPFAIRMATK